MKDINLSFDLHSSFTEKSSEFQNALLLGIYYRLTCYKPITIDDRFSHKRAMIKYRSQVRAYRIMLLRYVKNRKIKDISRICGASGSVIRNIITREIRKISIRMIGFYQNQGITNDGELGFSVHPPSWIRDDIGERGIKVSENTPFISRSKRYIKMLADYSDVIDSMYETGPRPI